MVRFDSNGQPEWIRDAPIDRMTMALTSHSDEVVLLTDSDAATTLNAGLPDETTLSGPGCLVAGYTPSGDLARAFSIGQGVCRDLVGLPGGEVIVAGQLEDSSEVLTGLNWHSHGPMDGYVARYDATGALVWSRLIVGDSEDTVYAMAARDDGALVFTGAVGVDPTAWYGEPDAISLALPWNNYVHAGYFWP